jgi:equilibrative nucleoside transporter 1/2/3
VAGVLPAIAQIASVLAIPQSKAAADSASPKSAFAYFMTATVVSGLCLVSFMLLLSRHDISINGKSQTKPLFPNDAYSEEEICIRKSVPLLDLLWKLKLTSFALFFNFGITMVYPVVTQAILSVRPEGSGRLFSPDVFIPTGFLLWNVGDLSGRLICGWDKLLIKDPRWQAILAVSRAAFVPLYFMCNIGGKGAVVESDLFFWLVQFCFGLGSGWIGSSCIITAPDHVEDDEKEACGGFMGLCLVLGLTTGSMLSFLVNV